MGLQLTYLTRIIFTCRQGNGKSS